MGMSWSKCAKNTRYCTIMRQYCVHIWETFAWLSNCEMLAFAFLLRHWRFTYANTIFILCNNDPNIPNGICSQLSWAFATPISSQQHSKNLWEIRLCENCYGDCLRGFGKLTVPKTALFLSLLRSSKLSMEKKRLRQIFHQFQGKCLALFGVAFCRSF